MRGTVGPAWARNALQKDGKKAAVKHTANKYDCLVVPATLLASEPLVP